MNLTNMVLNERHNIYCTTSFMESTETGNAKYTVEVRCDCPLAGQNNDWKGS